MGKFDSVHNFLFFWVIESRKGQLDAWNLNMFFFFSFYVSCCTACSFICRGLFFLSFFSLPKSRYACWTAKICSGKSERHREDAGFREGEEVSLISLKKNGLINPSGRERNLPLKVMMIWLNNIREYVFLQALIRLMRLFETWTSNINWQISVII